MAESFGVGEWMNQFPRANAMKYRNWSFVTSPRGCFGIACLRWPQCRPLRSRCVRSCAGRPRVTLVSHTPSSNDVRSVCQFGFVSCVSAAMGVWALVSLAPRVTGKEHLVRMVMVVVVTVMAMAMLVTMVVVMLRATGGVMRRIGVRVDFVAGVMPLLTITRGRHCGRSCGCAWARACLCFSLLPLLSRTSTPSGQCMHALTLCPCSLTTTPILHLQPTLHLPGSTC